MSKVKINSSSEEVASKALVVDDELATKTSQISFLNQINIPQECVLFAANYEAALEIIERHSEIRVCFVDVRIPKNDSDFYDYKEDELPEWGISLLPKINQFNKLAEINIYSAYVTKTYLREKAKGFNNIKGFYGKDDVNNSEAKIFKEGLRHLASNGQFDYDSLDSEVSDYLQVETAKLKELIRRSARDIIDIGATLIKIKDKLEHGQFYKWLETEFNWSIRTAQRFMRVAQRFKGDSVSHLDILPTALYELSKPSVPEAAAAEAISRAQKGETISVETARAIKSKYVGSVKTSPTAKRTREKTSTGKTLDSSVVKKTSLLSATSQIQPNTGQPLKKPEIVKVVRQQNVWQLGEHLLFCGDPNSPDFLERLPSKISLNLAFPAQRNWLFSYSHQIDSSLSFTSVYQSDLDSLLLGESIERIIKTTTDANNVATICFLPDPIVLQVAHQLGLRCFIAEPERGRCETMLSVWEEFEQK